MSTKGLLQPERCGRSFSDSASDTFHLGFRDVAIGGKPYDFGLPIDTRKPSECDGWRRIVAKAKADIAHWDRINRRRDVAAAITIEELTKTLEIMRAWANSLQKTEQLKDGSSELTAAAAS